MASSIHTFSTSVYTLAQNLITIAKKEKQSTEALSRAEKIIEKIETLERKRIANSSKNTEVKALPRKDFLIPINTIDEKGSTALIYASKRGWTELVKLLLKANAKCNIQNNAGNTALLLAAWQGYGDIASLLLDAGANPHIRNREGSLSLHLAIDPQHQRNKDTRPHLTYPLCDDKAHQSRIETMIVLANMTDCHLLDNHQNTVFHLAFLRMDHHFSLRHLIRLSAVLLYTLLAKTSEKIFDIQNKEGDTALHILFSKTYFCWILGYVCELNEVQKIFKEQIFPKFKGRCNIRNKKGQTLLHLASQRMFHTNKMVNTLIDEYKADILIDKNGYTPLHLTVQALTCNYINTMTDKTCFEEYSKLINNLLIRYPELCNSKTTEGHTPLVLLIEGLKWLNLFYADYHKCFSPFLKIIKDLFNNMTAENKCEALVYASHHHFIGTEFILDNLEKEVVQEAKSEINTNLSIEKLNRTKEMALDFKTVVSTSVQVKQRLITAGLLLRRMDPIHITNPLSLYNLIRHPACYYNDPTVLLIYNELLQHSTINTEWSIRQSAHYQIYLDINMQHIRLTSIANHYRMERSKSITSLSIFGSTTRTGTGAGIISTIVEYDSPLEGERPITVATLADDTQMQQMLLLRGPSV